MLLVLLQFLPPGPARQPADNAQVVVVGHASHSPYSRRDAHTSLAWHCGSHRLVAAHNMPKHMGFDSHIVIITNVLPSSEMHRN
ncbi:hypothetical protein ElyMa_002055600 [Elysia marginata]|uniref:Secreted protein n=1 Tax=Elysia marginata TaxID=1093978 RepID=A0AAV4F8W9_9GAST|nr:hypothetical protein ElyMa_002055600 [Elysia marginata]